jgi:8-oxo-dGTP diphosphatase
MDSPQPRYTRRGAIVVWLWRNLPLEGHVKSAIAWLVNLRFAVGVVAIIPNAEGQVFVQRHTYRREGHEWGLPGGWARGRESLERALVREVQEETGFTVEVGKLVAIRSGFAVPRLTVFYLARISGGAFRPSDEVSAYEFRAEEDLGSILPGDRLAVRQALGESR